MSFCSKILLGSHGEKTRRGEDDVSVLFRCSLNHKTCNANLLAPKWGKGGGVCVEIVLVQTSLAGIEVKMKCVKQVMFKYGSSPDLTCLLLTFTSGRGKPPNPLSRI